MDNIEENMSYSSDSIQLACDDCSMNGIHGLDNVLEMIKDTIDSGDNSSAKDYIGQVQSFLWERGLVSK